MADVLEREAAVFDDQVVADAKRAEPTAKYWENHLLRAVCALIRARAAGAISVRLKRAEVLALLDEPALVEAWSVDENHAGTAELRARVERVAREQTRAGRPASITLSRPIVVDLTRGARARAALEALLDGYMAGRP